MLGPDIDVGREDGVWAETGRGLPMPMGWGMSRLEDVGRERGSVLS